MAAFIKGDVVVVPFPFSGTAGAKRRPALVLASWPFGGSMDYLLSLISSQRVSDPYLLALVEGDIQDGTLAKQSYVRPTYLFAADEALIIYKVGTLQDDKLQQVMQTVVRLLS